jgi:hypothetical protein
MKTPVAYITESRVIEDRASVSWEVQEGKVRELISRRMGVLRDVVDEYRRGLSAAAPAATLALPDGRLTACRSERPGRPAGPSHP